VKVCFAGLDFFHPSECLFDLSEVFMLMQLRVDIAHFPREDRLGSVGLVRVTAWFTTAAEVGLLADHFRDVAMRRLLLISDN